MKFNKLLYILPLMILLLLSLASAGTLSEDTISYYDFNSSTYTIDRTGTYNLTQIGSTSAGTGIIGDSRVFNANSEGLKVTTTTSFMDYATMPDWTFNVWVKKSSSQPNFGSILVKGDSASSIDGHTMYVSVQTNNTVCFSYNDGTTPNRFTISTGSDTLTNNVWTMLTIVYEENVGSKIYFDKTLVGSSSNYAELRTAFSTVLGQYGGNAAYGFWGEIDEASIFNRPLTTNEITFLYNGGSPDSNQQYQFVESNPEVLTTNITSIYLNPNGTVYSDETTLKGVVALNQTSGIYLNYTYYVNDVAVVTGQDTTPTSNNDIPVLSNTYFEHRDEVKITALAVNSSNTSQRLSLPKTSNVLTISNYAPTVTASLSPLTALNETDINAYCTISDGDSDLMNVSWKIINDTGTYSSGNELSKATGAYAVDTISNTDTQVGNNYSIQCNVTDGYLTDTDTSVTGTIVDLLNFTVTAVNEWTGNPINTFNMTIAGGWCYQETANISTSCGGLNTGSYEFDGIHFNPSNDDLIDGNWNSGSTRSGDNVGNLTIIYNKPIHSNSESKIIYKLGTNIYDAPYNETIPLNCWNNNKDNITFLVQSIRDYSLTDGTNISCLSNTGYILMKHILHTTTISAMFYEEGIYWNINTTQYNTTTGTIITPIISEKLADVTITSDDYFNRTYPNWNLSENLEANLYQSEIGFTTSEYLTSDLLSGVTYVIDGQTNTTFHLSGGEYTVTASKSGYYDLNYTFNVTPLQSEIISLTDMYNSILNITATTYPTDSTLSSFNISVNGIDYTTTSNYIEIPTIQNRLNTLNISSDGYASRLNQEYTTTSTVNTTSYLMYPFNSVRILIYNGTTGGLLDFQNVTINTISELTTFENITTTGNITISFLSPLSYELRFESDNYTQTSYFITVTNDTSQEIKVYMTTNDSNTETQRVKVIDNGNNEIGGAIIWLQKENYGTYNTINQKVSGSDGLATFYVNKDINEYYRFIVIYNDDVKLTTEKTVFVPDIDDIIELVIDTATSSYSIPERINVTVWLTGDNEEFVNYQFIDPNSVINGARLVITMEDLTTGTITTRYNSTKSGVSDLFSVELDQLNDTIYTIKAYIINSDDTESLYWEGVKQFEITVILDRNTGLLYAIIIFIFAAFLTAASMKPLLSGIISLGILLPLTYLKLISIPMGIVTGFIVLFIIVFIKIKTGGNQ